MGLATVLGLVHTRPLSTRPVTRLPVTTPPQLPDPLLTAPTNTTLNHTSMIPSQETTIPSQETTILPRPNTNLITNQEITRHLLMILQLPQEIQATNQALTPQLPDPPTKLQGTVLPLPRTQFLKKLALLLYLLLQEISHSRSQWMERISLTVMISATFL